MKLLLYCTKGKPYLNDCRLTNHNKPYFISNKGLWSIDLSTQQTYSSLNGKIVAECDYEVEKITSKNLVSFEKESCLDRISMFKYLKPNLIWDNKFEILLNTFGGLTLGYAIHIKNLHIFDEPKELAHSSCDNDAYYYSEKYDKKRKCKVGYAITKAPQNMCYAYDNNVNKYVLISIRPEWLCKILNGEKTIIVRKKVLKRMEGK